jgi:hypothetical protein
MFSLDLERDSSISEGIFELKTLCQVLLHKSNTLSIILLSILSKILSKVFK